MKQQQWREIERVFEAALELDPAERSAWLTEESGADPEVQREVTSLLAHSGPDAGAEAIVARSRAALAESEHNPAASHSDRSPAFQKDGATALDRQPGEIVGPYRLISQLGEGGMGAVWEARRSDGEFEQSVAIKFVSNVGRSDDWYERFRSERQILARLEHPNIARLLDGGSTKDGQPFLVMEKVDGQDLLSYCDQLHLGVDARLRLFLEVASAVEHAHRSLIVHRDLKPANILVHQESGPKLLDFGIAKILEPAAVAPATFSADGAPADAPAGSLSASREAPARSQQALTLAGERLLTLDYASPEQIRGDAVTTVSDVYSLGVLLYELLTGRRPRNLAGISAAAREREMTAKDPTRPSRAVEVEEHEADEGSIPKASTRAALRGLAPRSLARRLRGDLDAIALRALQHDSAHRFGSVAEFAGDIERHLRKERVRTRPDSLSYRFSKLVQRHPWRLAAAGTIVVLTLALVAGQFLHGRNLQRERDRARAAEVAAQNVSTFLIDLFEVSDPDESRGRSITARELLDRGSVRIEQALLDEPEARATLLETLGDVHLNLGLRRRAEELHRLALAQRLELFGDEHLATAQSHDRLGDTLRQLAEMKSAEEQLSRSLAIRQRLLAADAPELADSLNNLGLLLDESGRRREAEPLLRSALEIRRSRLGVQHADTIVSMSNLGQLLMNAGRFDEAAPLLEEVLQTRLRLLGEIHPDVAFAAHALGTLRHRQLRWQEAEALLQQALRIRREVLPAEHAHIGVTLNNLAALLHDQDRLTAAESHYRQAIEIERRGVGSQSMGHAHTLSNLGSLLKDLGRFDEAEVLYEESLRRRAAALSPQSRSYQRTLSAMGRLALLAGQRDLAAERLHEAEQWMAANLEPNDRDYLRTRQRMALLEHTNGTVSGALTILEEVLEATSLQSPPSPALQAELGAQLASVYIDTSEPQRCLAAVIEARELSKSASALVRGRVALAEGLCHGELGRRDDAVAALMEAVERLSPFGADNHWMRKATEALEAFRR